jgi:hypothetical protein
MKFEKGYPYIGKIEETRVVVLFFKDSNGFIIDQGRTNWVGVHNDFDEPLFPNITKEYLTNTCGKVESEEHREMIVALARNAGFDETDHTAGDYFSFTNEYYHFTDERVACIYEEKLITLPIPPVDEGEEVKHSFTSGQKIFIAQINTNAGVANKRYFVQLYWCDSGHHREYVELGIIFDNKVDAENKCRDMLGLPPLPKPKTEEELLREDVIETIANRFTNRVSASFICDDLIEKYNITRKDK